MAYHPPPEIQAQLRSEVGIPAYLGSDRRIFQGSDDGFGTNEHGRRVAREKAAAAGVDVGGAKYFPTLAEEQGDPKAWLRDTTDISRRAAAIGADVDFGGRKFSAPRIEVPDDTPYEVADDIVEKEVQGIVETDHGGSVSKREYDDLFSEVKAKRSDVLI
jgi:hypothetical protein